MSAENATGEEKRICRDFQQGICDRGDRCKFSHPPGASPPKLPICKDFQNVSCDRMKCKFLHISKEEEAHYNATGQLPPHRGKPEHMSGMKRSYQPPYAPPPPPPQRRDARYPCKDFLNNHCQRGSSCKFRHISEREYQLEHQLEANAAYGKRRREDFAEPELVEENEMLKRKITDLQRQVVELRQMNDTLYEQNTRYRNQLRGTADSKEKMFTSTDIYDGYTKF